MLTDQPCNCDEYSLDFNTLVKGVEFIEGSVGVNGRLKHCYELWKTVVDAAQFVVSILSQGYKLPFTDIPGACYFQNNRSASDHSDLVEVLLQSCFQTVVSKSILALHIG